MWTTWNTASLFETEYQRRPCSDPLPKRASIVISWLFNSSPLGHGFPPFWLVLNSIVITSSYVTFRCHEQRSRANINDSLGDVCYSCITDIWECCKTPTISNHSTWFLTKLPGSSESLHAFFQCMPCDSKALLDRFRLYKFSWVFQPRGNFINFHISNVLMQLLMLPTLWERYPNLCSQQAVVDKGVFLPVLEDMMARRPGKGYWMKAQSWQWMTVIFSRCLGLYAVGTKKRSDQIDFEATNIKQNIK